MKFWLHKMRDFPLFLFKSRVGQQMKVMRYAIKLPHVTQVHFLLCWMKLKLITATSNVVLTLSSTDHNEEHVLEYWSHFMLSPRVSCLLLNIVSQYVQFIFLFNQSPGTREPWLASSDPSHNIFITEACNILPLIGQMDSLTLASHWWFWWLLLNSYGFNSSLPFDELQKDFCSTLS